MAQGLKDRQRNNAEAGGEITDGNDP